MGVQKSTLVISAEILSVKAGDNICFMSSFSFENTTSTMEPSMNNQNSYSFFWTLRDSNGHCLCAHNSPCFVIQCFICSFCSSNNSLETGESCIINPHCISVIWMWHPPQKKVLTWSFLIHILSWRWRPKSYLSARSWRYNHRAQRLFVIWEST